MPSPRSWVFLHFERRRRPARRGALQWEERNSCARSSCEESYSLTTSTTVLAKHLATHNMSSPATTASASSSSSSSSLPSPSSSSSILGKRERNQSTLDSVLVKLDNGDVVLKKRVKAYCRAAEAAEAVEEVADEVIHDAPVVHGS
jgi:hypothetical protein